MRIALVHMASKTDGEPQRLQSARGKLDVLLSKTCLSIAPPSDRDNARTRISSPSTNFGGMSMVLILFKSQVRLSGGRNRES